MLTLYFEVMNMKKQYIQVEIETVNVESCDVITTSFPFTDSPFDGEDQPLRNPGLPNV